MKKISLADSTIDSDELNQLADWIKTNPRLTKGDLTVEFEEKFAQWQGSKHAIFVNSGSSANLLVAQALLESERLRNKIIIAPAVAWVTTVTPFLQLGYDVKLCDCDRHNLGIDTVHFEKLCEMYRPAAVILVHVLGHGNDMVEISRICSQYKVELIEDSCESLGSIYHGKKLGSIGLTGSFSFYYGHHISTIEGGMIVTDDTEFYYLMLSIRSHGWGRDLPDNIHAEWKKSYEIDEIRDFYTFYHSGFNLRSTDLNAFLGLKQIKKLDLICQKREMNHKRYLANLQSYWNQTSETSFLSSFAFPTVVENRLESFKHLKNMNIECRPLICGNIGQHPFWAKKFGPCSLSNADVVHEYGIYLPNHFNLSDEDIDFICEEFKKIARPYANWS